MSYDVVIIGSGPGGYVCAIKAAQLGLKIAVVEKSKNFGGTCLNVGCIPSKALLHASEVYAEACRGFDALGITLSKPELKISEMMQHKQSMIAANTKGVNFLFKNNKIDSFLGSGKILESGKVEVLAKDGKKFLLETKNIVIATGAAAANIPGINIVIDENVVVSSTGALSFEKVPNTMVVIGAGVIGSELGLVWRRLGAKVIIIEFLDKVLSTMDVELSRKFQKFMENQGIIYKLGTKVTEIVKSGAGAIVSFEPVTGGKTEQVATDVVLIAVGRRPFIEGLGLQAAGVVLDKHGRISIDRRWHTNISGIYAIGDVVGGTMLAHNVIPSVVYTQPEVASIGKTEEELKADGVTYKVGKCSFTANSRARAMRRTDGFVKILACAKTDRVLGGHIVGFGASEMIHELAVLMAFSGSSEDLGRLCHAHPTMSETIRESAFAIFSKPIHI